MEITMKVLGEWILERQDAISSLPPNLTFEAMSQNSNPLYLTSIALAYYAVTLEDKLADDTLKELLT